MKQNVVRTECQQSIIGCDNGPTYRSIRGSPLSLFFFFKWLHRASLVAQLVKNSLAMQEALVQLLGREDPLGKG